MPMGKQYGPPRRPSEYHSPIGINQVPTGAEEEAAAMAARAGVDAAALKEPVKPAKKSPAAKAPAAQAAAAAEGDEQGEKGEAAKNDDGEAVDAAG